MLEIFPERGGDPDRPGKKDPLDCVVWRGEREGEPSWESPFGPGRPGWHIECTAIAQEHLGGAFDVQGGGSDLVFPHHEMCAGHAQVAAPGVAVREGLQPRRHGRLRRREDVEVAGQPGLRLGAAQQRRRPDGDPAGAAAPPLPQRLGVDRRRAVGRRRRRRPLAPGAVAGRRRAGRAGRRGGPRRPRGRPRRPPRDRRRGPLGGRHPRHRRTSPTPPTRTPRCRCSRCWTPPSGWRSERLRLSPRRRAA